MTAKKERAGVQAVLLNYSGTVGFYSSDSNGSMTVSSCVIVV